MREDNYLAVDASNGLVLGTPEPIDDAIAHLYEYLSFLEHHRDEGIKAARIIEDKTWKNYGFEILKVVDPATLIFNLNV